MRTFAVFFVAFFVLVSSAVVFEAPGEAGTGALQATQLPKKANEIQIRDEYPLKDGCGIPRMTQKLWDSGEGDKVIKWMREQMKYYNKDDQGATSFVNYILEVFFPDDAPHFQGCNLVDECSYVNCKSLRADIKDEQERRMAVYAANSFSNFYTFFRNFMVEVRDAAQVVDRMHAELPGLFTWSDVYRGDELKKQQKALATLDILLPILLTVGSVIGAAGGLIPGEKQVISFLVGAIGGTISASSAGAHTKLTRKIKADNDYFQKQEIQWASYWVETTQLIDGFFQDMTLDYVRGLADANDNTIIDIIQGAHFYLPFPVDIARKATKQVRKEMLATSINHMWASEHTYFVGAPTQDNDCKNDDRGHEASRVCLKEWPKIVLHGYGVDRRSGDDSQYTRLLPGLSELQKNSDKYYGITLEDVGRSSYNWYRATKNKKLPGKTNEVVKAFNFSGAADYVENKQIMGFRLPLCLTGQGEAISSLNADASLNYPCMCGDFSWDQPHDGQKDETKDFLQASGLFTRKYMYKHCKSDDHAECESSGSNTFGLDCEQTIRGEKIEKKWCKKGPFEVCTAKDLHEDKGEVPNPFGH